MHTVVVAVIVSKVLVELSRTMSVNVLTSGVVSVMVNTGVVVYVAVLVGIITSVVTVTQDEAACGKA